MFRRKVQPLDDLLNQFLRQEGLESPLLQKRIIAAWDTVAGETVQLSEARPNGWYQVVVQGNGLGFTKVTGNILKNYYPKGLRFR